MNLTGAVWRKARRSAENGGNCVEVAAVDGRMAVRDSKDPGPNLGFTSDSWTAFLEDVKRGRFTL